MCQSHRHESQGQQRGQLDLRRQRDQDGAEHHDRQRGPAGQPEGQVRRSRRRPAVGGSHGLDAAQRELGAGEHQAQHQRLVVDAGHQMHEQQRIAGAQPQRADLRDAAAAGQPWGGPDDESDADQYDQTMEQHGFDDVLAGDARDAPPDPQEQRTVGRRRLPPQAGHRQREDVVQPQAGRRSDPVGVAALQRDLALGQIGVHVLAVHRRSDEQR